MLRNTYVVRPRDSQPLISRYAVMTSTIEAAIKYGFRDQGVVRYVDRGE